MGSGPYEVEFYEDANGASPPLEWLRGLDPTLRRAAGVAMEEILEHYGVDVCDTEWGKPLGGGLYEFRVRHDADEILRRTKPGTKRLFPKRKIVLRIFFHPHGNRLLLVVGGFNKLKFPKRQDKEIKTARERLQDWKDREKA